MASHEWRLLRFVPPSLAIVEAMTQAERRTLFLQLTVLAQQVAAAQATVAALLGVEDDEPLWTAKEVGRVLGVHPETVRDHGAAWGIEVELPGTDVHRYSPRHVRALRERRQTSSNGETLS